MTRTTARSFVSACLILGTLLLTVHAQNDLDADSAAGGADVAVNSISPAVGTILGGQRLHVDGSGFNLEFFEGSNVVTLISEKGVERNCVVLEGACTVDCGSSKRIVCEIEYVLLPPPPPLLPMQHADLTLRFLGGEEGGGGVLYFFVLFPENC